MTARTGHRSAHIIAYAGLAPDWSDLGPKMAAALEALLDASEGHIFGDECIKQHARARAAERMIREGK